MLFHARGKNIGYESIGPLTRDTALYPNGMMKNPAKRRKKPCSKPLSDKEVNEIISILRQIRSNGYSPLTTRIRDSIFILGVIGGVMCTCSSVLIRMELARPSVQLLGGNNQLYNVLITTNAFLMIFFMVMSAIIGGSCN